jgi:hypothetical protein
MADEHVQKTLEELSRNLQESKARREEAQRVAYVGISRPTLSFGRTKPIVSLA